MTDQVTKMYRKRERNDDRVNESNKCLILKQVFASRSSEFIVRLEASVRLFPYIVAIDQTFRYVIVFICVKFIRQDN